MFARLLLLLTVMSPLASLQVATGQNHVDQLQRGVARCQVSSHNLVFAMPEGWTADDAGARQLGVCGVLVPEGLTLATTKAVIILIFQQRDPNNPKFADYENYAQANLNVLKSQKKGVNVERVALDGRSGSPTRYAAYEVWGKNGPSPSIFMYLDAADGFYTITVTLPTRDALKATLVTKFLATLDVT